MTFDLHHEDRHASTFSAPKSVGKSARKETEKKIILDEKLGEKMYVLEFM
nr:hypothetical protein [Microctonus hyperodae filamentous virus]